jgi:hypothetical protein
VGALYHFLRERLRHRRINQRTQVPAQRQPSWIAHYLGHEHHGQLFLRVDPEGRRGDAALSR